MEHVEWEHDIEWHLSFLESARTCQHCWSLTLDVLAELLALLVHPLIIHEVASLAAILLVLVSRRSRIMAELAIGPTITAVTQVVLADALRRSRRLYSASNGTPAFTPGRGLSCGALRCPPEYPLPWERDRPPPSWEEGRQLSYDV